MQMGLAGVVIHADDAPLEDREEIFGGVGMLEPAIGDIFLRAVIDLVVRAELATNLGIDGAFIGH